MIQDSGNRTEFSSGAVRDIQKGKGRFDLVPMEIMAEDMNSFVIEKIDTFKKTKSAVSLIDILTASYTKLGYVEYIESEIEPMFPDAETMWIEVSIHFEEGAEKYGENNWKSSKDGKVGLPIECYINSMTRHYLKWLRGDTDERHDRAFVWNVICCLWTLAHTDD